jgi:hypothetical protein
LWPKKVFGKILPLGNKKKGRLGILQGFFGGEMAQSHHILSRENLNFPEPNLDHNF